MVLLSSSTSLLIFFLVVLGTVERRVFKSVTIMVDLSLSSVLSVLSLHILHLTDLADGSQCCSTGAMLAWYEGVGQKFSIIL